MDRQVYAKYMPFEYMPRSGTALPYSTWEFLWEASTLIYTVDALVAPTFSSAYIATLFYVHCVLCVSMSVHMFALPSEAETEHSSHRNRSCRQVWPAMRVLGMEPRGSGRVSSTLNHWTISPTPYAHFLHLPRTGADIVWTSSIPAKNVTLPGSSKYQYARQFLYKQVNEI